MFSKYKQSISSYHLQAIGYKSFFLMRTKTEIKKYKVNSNNNNHNLSYSLEGTTKTP